MDVKTVACDQCSRQKQETNHWLVEITRPGFEGIIFQPAETTEDPRNPDFIYKDLCGQECAHKRLAQWLDDLNSFYNPPLDGSQGESVSA